MTHLIDQFLRSLAQDQGKMAAAVILSGTGTDGSLGAKEINAQEGVVFVQSKDSAAYDGMPRSAIKTGLVDLVLPPGEMPEKLQYYFSHPKIVSPRKSLPPAMDTQQQWLNKIFALLRTQVGHDFSGYKTNTIVRRLNRRMALNQIDSQETYVRYLRENPSEGQALFRELLIGVTSFFRDAKSFEVLKNKILPGLLEQLEEGDTFRAWVPGCSTGEEAYSLAMVLQECLEAGSKRVNVQLFGTDIDPIAIDRAREGLFPESISADLSQERLKRFLSKEGNFFRIRKAIRERVVFSVQDMIKDPPFSRLDLLCCRNLLIYLNSPLQKKLLPLFHYTLKPGGVLVLGSSETIGGFTNLFQILDTTWKIYKRQEVPEMLRQQVDFPSGIAQRNNALESPAPAPAIHKTDLSRMTQKAILEQFAPPAILVDANGEVLHIQGRTGKYLESPSGPPTQNILDLAREGLRLELSSAFRAAKTSKQEVIRKNISIRIHGDLQMIDLHVSPQRSPTELADKFLVVFQDIEAEPQALRTDREAEGEPQAQAPRIAELEKELQSTRESHQTTTEELESSNEELKSTNEELQSSNEELQSTNEELESSKEELQSLNEELQTVNAELQSKVDELSTVQDDMKNLLNSTAIATIFVDNDLRVRRYTQEATKIVNFIQTDIGRPLEHVVSNLSYAGVLSDLSEVLNKLTIKQSEVQTTDGKWFQMRIIPYRTTDNRIDGAVLTFSSIDEQKRDQDVLKTESLEQGQDSELVRAVFDLNPEPMVVLDDAGRVLISNAAFSELVQIPEARVQHLDFFDAHTALSKNADLTSKLKSALQDRENFQSNACALNTQTYTIQGRHISTANDVGSRMLLRFEKA